MSRTTLTSRVQRRCRRAAPLLAAAGALLLAPLVLAAPASAHDELAGSVPASGATVTTAPAVVTLHFEEAPLTSGLAVSVTAPDTSPVTSGTPTVSGTDVVAPLLPLTQSGSYAVSWRVVADDGHPVTGTFSFTLDLPTAGATASSPASAPVTATGPATSPSAVAEAAAESTTSTPVAWIIGGAVVLALLAGLFAVLSHRRST